MWISYSLTPITRQRDGEHTSSDRFSNGKNIVLNIHPGFKNWRLKITARCNKKHGVPSFDKSVLELSTTERNASHASFPPPLRGVSIATRRIRASEWEPRLTRGNFPSAVLYPRFYNFRFPCYELRVTWNSFSYVALASKCNLGFHRGAWKWLCTPRSNFVVDDLLSRFFFWKGLVCLFCLRYACATSRYRKIRAWHTDSQNLWQYFQSEPEVSMYNTVFRRNVACRKSQSYFSRQHWEMSFHDSSEQTQRRNNYEWFPF